jgi:hypothetical protein
MEWFEEWGEIANSLDKNLNTWIKEGFSIYKDQAIELNKGQLSEGKDTKGTALSPYSTPYKRKRIKAGLQVSRKDLNFTGEHYKGFYGLALQNYFEMGSKDWKADILEHNYPGIYGIPEADLDDFLDAFIWPHVQTRFIESIQ